MSGTDCHSQLFCMEYVSFADQNHAPSLTDVRLEADVWNERSTADRKESQLVLLSYKKVYLSRGKIKKI